MTGGCIARDREGTRAVLRISGAFDRECAWALREELDDELEAEELTLDFRQVDDFSDMAVALLANGLVRLRARVQVLGLGTRQLRILRYCEARVMVESESGEEPPAHPAGHEEQRLEG